MQNVEPSSPSTPPPEEPTPTTTKDRQQQQQVTPESKLQSNNYNDWNHELQLFGDDGDGNDEHAEMEEIPVNLPSQGKEGPKMMKTGAALLVGVYAFKQLDDDYPFW